MTNFEYFKDEILEATKHEYGFGIKKDDGRIVSCPNIRCSNCQFSGWRCGEDRIRWGLEEHIEKPKLTKKERQFCELVETGWIVRCNGVEECNLFCYKNEPTKSLEEGIWLGTCAICIDVRFPGCNFDFIKWDPEDRYQRPWSVEELLKLEYEQ